MSRRRRSRFDGPFDYSRVSVLSEPNYVSRLARKRALSSASQVSARVFPRVSDRLQVRPVRGFNQPVRSQRLRTSKAIAVSAHSARMHGSFQIARDCVRDVLSGFKSRRGLSTRGRKSAGRDVSRRQLFIAARKSC